MNAFDFSNLSLDKSRIAFVNKCSSQWTLSDYLGALRVRCSIGRNNYSVTAGLYKLGSAGKESPIFVSANYKLSFDVLRRELSGMDAWILVLDTKGVNVWCAAGKGSFGTNELINRIKIAELSKHVNHRKLILPQLGAPGIAALKIKKETGFQAVYGPVKAMDIPVFIQNNYTCTEQMRTVQFGMKDRVILTPVEISNSLKYLVIIIAVFFALAGFDKNGFNLNNLWSDGFKAAIIIVTAYFSGAFLTPILLPWVPSRFFSLKGALVGAVTFFGLFLLNVIDFNWIHSLGWFLFALSVSSFLAMNFTGSSTYTSLSGVKKEMALFVPIQLIAAVAGALIIIVSKLFWL